MSHIAFELLQTSLHEREIALYLKQAFVRLHRLTLSMRY